MSTCDGKFCEGSVSVTVTVSFAGPLTRSLDRAGVKRERKGEIEWLAVIPLLVCGEESVSLPPPLRPLDLAATLPGLCATLLRLVPGLFGDRRCRSLRWTSGGNGRSCGDDPVMAGDGWSTRAPARTVTEGPSLSSQPGTDEGCCCCKNQGRYYLKTGTCKFGAICKFHHPKEKAGIAGRVQLNILGYPLRPGQLGSSPESQRTTGTAQFYGPSQQGGAQGKFPSYRPGSAPMGLYAVPGENIFPERPGQPECQFYMKTGDCKFGAVCKFHHPKERLVPVPNCVLSPLGLPLRPGEPVCVFYSRYGICKFGPNCKFDHPMGTFTYGLSASSATGVPTAWHLLGSSLEPPTLAPPPSQGTANGSSGASRRISISESRHTATGNENEEAES
ncbi:zinc finger CCCH domain-containing protein [Musa troglodytarum]|uniref:Zinc finger CCCH domain-containing protein n=1 Tax=Musa troglodytarum TaxID=320322 RepID=A0A9E7H2I4_9LILI|nr:zinc finger CCCH domain-containing protein [Musa troglodytarum]